MRGSWLCLCLLVLLAGCQSSHQKLIDQGYPPAYADGFRDGCGSGHQAGGALGEFRKNVPRYLHERQYESGWDDGFRQCQGMQQNRAQQNYYNRHWDEREERWQQEKDRDAARAYRR